MTGARTVAVPLAAALANLAAAAAPFAPAFGPWHNSYTDSFVSKIFLRDHNADKSATTMDQALELVEAVEEITGGAHQIIYLVGWQHDGHDSKFPDMSVVGPQCRSSLSDDPAQSLRLAMRIAREKHNCDLSLHINMSDCHVDSPLWKAYNDENLLALDAQGRPKKFGYWYWISHAKEWKSGRSVRRVDALLEMLPELKSAGTVHLDAFFARTSEKDGISLDDDKAAIRDIARCFYSRGVDATTEFITSEDMIGVFPMVYHCNFDERLRMIVPESSTCGGDNAWNGRLYADYFHRGRVGAGPILTSPGAGCCYDEAWGIGHFCDMTARHLDRRFLADELFRTAILFIWYNRTRPIRHSMSPEEYVVERGGGVVATVRMADRHLTVRENGRLVVDGSDCFLDMPYGVFLAHSAKGCSREFALPPSVAGAESLSGVRLPGREPAELPVSAGCVRVVLAPGETFVVKPKNMSKEEIR